MWDGRRCGVLAGEVQRGLGYGEVMVTELVTVHI